MSGFQFSLKGNKISKNGNQKSIKALGKTASIKKSLLFTEETSSNDSKKPIDAFHPSQGAMSGSVAIEQKPLLIIKPTKCKSSLKAGNAEVLYEDSSKNTAELNRSDFLLENKARQDLLSGENSKISRDSVISVAEKQDDVEAAPEEYDDIPVEEFGAALLRGMGWDGEEMPDTRETHRLSYRKKGALLGIGAKAIERDMENELMSKKNISAPLIKGSIEEEK